MLRVIILATGLFVLWLLLSGLFKPLLISLGIISSLATVMIAVRMGILKPEIKPIRYSLPSVPAYLVWLMMEIAKSNWAVTKTIFAGKNAIRQKLFHVPVTQQSDIGKVLYANSITLTPGTITVETEDGYFLTHALSYAPSDLDALADMDKRVTALEKQAETKERGGPPS